jgi:hypothetical protein
LGLIYFDVLYRLCITWIIHKITWGYTEKISTQTINVEYHWSTKCGILDVSKFYRPPRPVTGIVSLHPSFLELSDSVAEGNIRLFITLEAMERWHGPSEQPVQTSEFLNQSIHSDSRPCNVIPIQCSLCKISYVELVVAICLLHITVDAFVMVSYWQRT